MVPENVIQEETDTLSGELAWALVTNNGERAWNVVRLGLQVARFEMVARTSASGHRQKGNSSSRAAVAMAQSADHRNRINFAAFRQLDLARNR